MVLNTGIPVLRKFMLKDLQKIPFGEGLVQDSIPALPGHGSKFLAVLLGDRISLAYIEIFSSLGAEMWKYREQTDGRTDGRTERATISKEHFFFKTWSKKYDRVLISFKVLIDRVPSALY
jgi:hypothetical protein